MASQHSPSKTPNRRVLGSLAINTPQNLAKAYEAYEASGVTRAQSPLKHVTTHTHTHTPPSFQDKENFVTPDASSKSKKRGIDEVDSAETAQSLKMLARSGDNGAVETGMRLTTEAVQRHTQNNPIGLADPGSPTERATPSPEPEPIQHSQKSSQSFSDLLNYEMCASQKSEHGITNVMPPPPVPAPASSQEKRRSRAEQLRTRLKFGLYKVKTNQVTKRDADIIGTYEAKTCQVSAPHRYSYSLDALNASMPTTITSSRESLDAYRVPNITVSSPQRGQAPSFIQANLDPFRPVGKLGPAPVQFAMPKDNFQASSQTIQGYEPSSSPPGASLPNYDTHHQYISPNYQRSHHQAPAASVVSTTGYGAGNDAREDTAHQRLQRLKEQQYMDSSISGLQDNAAKGLIQLMQGGR
ncbi:hypothetical protein PTNB29_00904 [Pyrenophora teres f. teres]|nr:hypothetical protein PTNB29_00904 [Pyrenophora teres f. teres]